MANRERGELTLVAHTRSYVLRLSVEACCQLEDRTGWTLTTLVNGLNHGEAAAARGLCWAALQPYHGAQVPTLMAAGDVIDACGGLPVVAARLSELLALNRGDDAPSADAGDDSQADADAARDHSWRRLYVSARQYGLQPEVFWQLSLRELWLELAARRAALEAESRRDRSLAWHTAVYALAGFGGKLPPLSDVLQVSRRQTPEQMKRVVEMLAQIYPNTRHAKGAQKGGRRGDR